MWNPSAPSGAIPREFARWRRFAFAVSEDGDAPGATGCRKQEKPGGRSRLEHCLCSLSRSGFSLVDDGRLRRRAEICSPSYTGGLLHVSQGGRERRVLNCLEVDLLGERRYVGEVGNREKHVGLVVGTRWRTA
jgi:hypothetical protein